MGVPLSVYTRFACRLQWRQEVARCPGYAVTGGCEVLRKTHHPSLKAESVLDY